VGGGLGGTTHGRRGMNKFRKGESAIMNGTKILTEGQSCRHCGTPVVRREHDRQWRPKANQTYFFEWWFTCPNPRCGAIYTVNAAKRYTTNADGQPVFER
jgi:hypothetical protein